MRCYVPALDPDPPAQLPERFSVIDDATWIELRIEGTRKRPVFGPSAVETLQHEHALGLAATADEAAGLIRTHHPEWTGRPTQLEFVWTLVWSRSTVMVPGEHLVIRGWCDPAFRSAAVEQLHADHVCAVKRMHDGVPYFAVPANLSDADVERIMGGPRIRPPLPSMMHPPRTA